MLKNMILSDLRSSELKETEIWRIIHIWYGYLWGNHSIFPNFKRKRLFPLYKGLFRERIDNIHSLFLEIYRAPVREAIISWLVNLIFNPFASNRCSFTKHIGIYPCSFNGSWTKHPVLSHRAIICFPVAALGELTMPDVDVRDAIPIKSGLSSRHYVNLSQIFEKKVKSMLEPKCNSMI